MAITVGGTTITFNDGSTQSTAGSALGVGQSWQSVSRSSGTTYTNSTGKPIQVMITVAAGQAANFFVGGFSSGSIGTYGADVNSISFIVPVSATYGFTGSYTYFFELS
jgi:hypothetical protein